MGTSKRLAVSAAVVGTGLLGSATAHVRRAADASQLGVMTPTVMLRCEMFTIACRDRPAKGTEGLFELIERGPGGLLTTEEFQGVSALLDGLRERGSLVALSSPVLLVDSGEPASMRIGEDAEAAYPGAAVPGITLRTTATVDEARESIRVEYDFATGRETGRTFRLPSGRTIAVVDSVGLSGSATVRTGSAFLRARPKAHADGVEWTFLLVRADVTPIPPIGCGGT